MPNSVTFFEATHDRTAIRRVQRMAHEFLRETLRRSDIVRTNLGSERNSTGKVVSTNGE
ncbi:hypothetical protein D3C87_1628180 [compost metagenome]